MQLCNFVLFSSSLSSPRTPLCCLISLCIYTESQTISRRPHPRPHNASALVPIPPMCQILFGGGHLGNIPKTSLNLLLSLWPSNRGWKYHVQAPLSASYCKLCHMQMAASGAIYPQLLSGVGSDAHYRGLLPALSCYNKWQQWVDEQLWLAGCLIAAEVAPPLSWRTAATEEKPLSETRLLMCRVWDCWQSCTPLTEFSICITAQPIHLLLLPPCFPACRSSAERIGRRRRSRKGRDWKSLKGFKWRPTEHLKTRTAN